MQPSYRSSTRLRQCMAAALSACWLIGTLAGCVALDPNAHADALAGAAGDRTRMHGRTPQCPRSPPRQLELPHSLRELRRLLA